MKGLSQPRPAARSPRERLQAWVARLTGSRLFWAAFIGALFALPIGRSLARTLPPAPPRLGQVEPFELDDQYGSKVGSEQLKGHVWMLTFLPPEGAPGHAAAVETTRQLIHRTKNLGALFHVVTLPTDPKAASREDRKAVIEKYCSSSQLWSYLGGTEEEVSRAESRILGAVSAGTPPPTTIALVDARGSVRGVYESDPSSIDRLMQDTGYVANIP